jgi:hypothetical protein
MGKERERKKKKGREKRKENNLPHLNLSFEIIHKAITVTCLLQMLVKGINK